MLLPTEPSLRSKLLVLRKTNITHALKCIFKHTIYQRREKINAFFTSLLMLGILLILSILILFPCGVGVWYMWVLVFAHPSTHADKRTGLLLHCYLPYCLETVLQWTGKLWFKLGWLKVSSWNTPMSSPTLPQCWVTGMYSHASLLIWVLGLKLSSSCFQSKCSYPLNHLLSPINTFTLIHFWKLTNGCLQNIKGIFRNLDTYLHLQKTSCNLWPNFHNICSFCENYCNSWR